MRQLLAAFGIPSLDFAMGERGQEEVMIKVSTAGSFPLSRVVVAGIRVSVRAAGHDVQVRVSWRDAYDAQGRGLMRDLLHDRNGALDHERHRHGMGADALARDAAGAWEPLTKTGREQGRSG